LSEALNAFNSRPVAGERRAMVEPNMLGAYGPWAAEIVGDVPARLSFRNARFHDVDAWRKEARARLDDCLLQPKTGGTPKATVLGQVEYDGLQVESLSWQLPYGPPTEALFLKPKGERGPLPGVVGLHDHGGNKYFGTRKITRTGDNQHPLMTKHQEAYYGGKPWANELAKRGYAVLVHDAFLFGSRRVRAADLPKVIKGDLEEKDPESEAEIAAYNKFAGNHEHLVAKSLFCAGTTWPGVFSAEDQRAVDYLCSRPDVDPQRVGCAGLSGGGLRTVLLSGLDDRIRCACCLGMMTTWRDYLLNKCHTHTWMIYIPGLPLDLDYPEVMALRAPKPSLVLSCVDDGLFTLPEMKRADRILTEVYQKAGAEDRYRTTFHPGGHKFDLPMQQEAFAWFDRWLKN
jgi:dienelactone hydrolase